MHPARPSQALVALLALATLALAAFAPASSGPRPSAANPRCEHLSTRSGSTSAPRA